MKLLLTLAACCVVAIGCKDEQRNQVVTRKYRLEGPPALLVDLLEAGPTNAFEKAILTNNFNFLGVMGYSVVVPGIPQDLSELYRRKGQVSVLPGTGDEILYSSQMVYMEQAMTFSSNYNRLLLRFLTNKTLPSKGPVKDAN